MANPKFSITISAQHSILQLLPLVIPQSFLASNSYTELQDENAQKEQLDQTSIQKFQERKKSHKRKIVYTCKVACIVSNILKIEGSRLFCVYVIYLTGTERGLLVFNDSRKEESCAQKCFSKVSDTIETSDDKGKGDKVQNNRFWQLCNIKYFINQFIHPSTAVEQRAVAEFSQKYKRDLEKLNGVVRTYRSTTACNVCGRVGHTAKFQNIVKCDRLFDPLRTLLTPDWVGYFHNPTTPTTGNHTSDKHCDGQNSRSQACVCDECMRHLIQKRLPKLSRVNIPILFPHRELGELTDVETLLISPIIPIS